MPSSALYSSALNNAPNNVLVESCDVNEESTGIVRVGINYVCKGANLEAVSQNMILDSEPPVYPQAVFRDQLERGRLYQHQRTYELEYGIGRVRAYYVGVLRRGQDPQVQTDTASFSVTAPLYFREIARLTGISDVERRFQLAFPQIAESGLGDGVNALASVYIQGRNNILRRKFGAIVSPSAGRNLGNLLLEQLVLNATVVVYIPAIETGYIDWVLNLFGLPPNSDLSTYFTPIEWINAFPGAIGIETSLETDFITPSVAVFNSNSRLFTQDTAIKYPVRPGVSNAGLTQG